MHCFDHDNPFFFAFVRMKFREVRSNKCNVFVWIKFLSDKWTVWHSVGIDVLGGYGAPSSLAKESWWINCGTNAYSLFLSSREYPIG